jgi:hypothetical protein
MLYALSKTLQTTRHTIYSNAMLTISATSATSVHDGFLAKRIRPEKDPQWFQLPFHSGDDNGQSTIFARQSTTYRASSEPLNKRAWALQEDILSPRVVTYDSYRIRWQCRTGHYADGGKVTELGLDLNLNQKLVAFDIGNQKGYIFPDALKAWFKIIETYSLRTATFPSDTLPAISALAEHFSHILGDGYLAGLWDAYLPQCLMWFVHLPDDYDLSQSRKTSQYIAPSWAWASLNGPVWFGHRFGMPDDIKIHINVEECSVRRASEHMRFGEVVGGQLIVSGFLKPAICLSIEQKHRSTTFRMMFDAQEPEPVLLSHSIPKTSAEGLSRPSPETWIFYPDNPQDFLREQVHLHALLVCSWDSFGVRLIAGLVIGKVARGEKEGRQLWIRRGLFHGTDRSKRFEESEKVVLSII